MSTKNPMSGWLAAIAAINPATSDLRPRKKRDDGDTPLGTLDGEMQQHWLYIQSLAQQVREIAQKFEDVIHCHEVDREIHGESLPVEKCKDFGEKLSQLTDEMRKPAFEYRIHDNIFHEILHEHFPRPEDRSVYGVREGFVIVCREHDDRGDQKDPIEEWKNMLKRHIDSLLGGLMAGPIFHTVLTLVRKEEQPKTEAAPNPTDDEPEK